LSTALRSSLAIACARAQRRCRGGLTSGTELEPTRTFQTVCRDRRWRTRVLCVVSGAIQRRRRTITTLLLSWVGRYDSFVSQVVPRVGRGVNASRRMRDPRCSSLSPLRKPATRLPMRANVARSGDSPTNRRDVVRRRGHRRVVTR
jgi:hypothetical protein